jgi:hypothetical protein
LNKLILAPNLSKEIKEDLDEKFSKIIYAEKSLMYGGAFAFVMQVLRNKFKFTKTLPLYIITPYILMFGTKVVGTKWIDFQM